MFPSYTADGSAAYDEYALDDPLQLNGISDADVAAFMASSGSPPVNYAVPAATTRTGYPYPEQLIPSRSPPTYARPLLPSSGKPATTQGVKRNAGAQPTPTPARKHSKSSSTAAAATTTPAEPEKPRLRTSTRTAAKRQVASPHVRTASLSSASAAKAHPRTPHHFTEKKYRDRLNDQFGRLLQALETSASREFADMGSEADGGMAGRFLSKSAVLEMARHRLRALEKENEGLAREVERLAEILRARPVV